MIPNGEFQVSSFQSEFQISNLKLQI
jgi:hypothetical protein